MNFDSYRLSALQDFMSILNQFESEGVSDVRFMRSKISLFLESKRVGAMKVARKTTVRANKIEGCPSCNNGYLVGPYNIDDLLVVRCSQKCGFSKVIS